MPTYGLGATAQNLLNQPYGGISPFAPAGMTDAQRQGQMTTLQGMGSQYQPAQDYATRMGGLLQETGNQFRSGMASNQFGWNPQMQQAVDLSQQGAGGNPFTTAANRQNWSALDPGQYGMSNAAYGQSTNQPYLNQAGGQVGSTLSNYGGGYSTGMADLINTTGASFDPNNPYLQSQIGAANQQLGRDFNQQVMPQMDRAAIGSGVGGYGGARAGVAQGIREQGLADAMQRQTTDMMNQGYEAGLNRYVQDRGQTLGTTIDAMRTGGQLGMSGAQTLGNLGQMQGALQQGAAAGYGSNAANMANNRLGAAGISAGLSGQQQNAQLGAASQIGGLGQYGLGQNNQMMSNFYGSMLPGAVNNAYQAGMQPGQVMQGIGGQLSGYGGQQQANNQAVVDWQNQAFNHAQQYPQSQFANYAANISPLTAQAGQQPQGPTQGNPFTAGLGGAMAGYGAYNSWNQSQNQQTGTGVAQGSGQLPGGHYGNLPGTYGYGGSTMPPPPAVGGFGY